MTVSRNCIIVSVDLSRDTEDGLTDDDHEWLRWRKLGLRGDRQAAHDAVVAQIQAEKAGALARAANKLERAWTVAHELGEGVRSGVVDIERYRVAREASRRARWELRIHREAMRLAWHADYDARWPELPVTPEASGPTGSGS